MTETTVRHAVRFTLNGEAVTAHVASHETRVREIVDAVQVAARTRVKRRES